MILRLFVLLLQALEETAAASVAVSQDRTKGARRAMAEDAHTHIEALVAEEHSLWEHEAQGTASENDRRRLEEIKVELDRYWDLLRRRRAEAAAGGDPDRVELRSEGTVEGYLQ